MDNRDRDKVSQSEQPTDAGRVNRDTESRRGQSNSDSDATFGQNIGRSEKWDEEPSRRTNSDDDATLDMKRNSASSGRRNLEH